VLAGTPCSKNPRWNGNAVIYSKIGIGNFTMVITINPDFWQVKADPSIMNLTTLKSYYQEKRPFFLEGKQIFNFSFDNTLLVQYLPQPTGLLTIYNCNSFPEMYIQPK
jgi:hypothetical protein